jgi:hypothetical protein
LEKGKREIMSREWSTEETAEMWLKHVWRLIDHLEDKGSDLPPRTLLKRLAFNLLATIDGTARDLPGFILAPRPQPEDMQYCIDSGENYFPQNHGVPVKADIGGNLHDLFHSFDTRPGKQR